MSKIYSSFNKNTPYTIGIEEEYMLCDPETGNLINRADEIIKSLNSKLMPRYSYELIQSEIEINTSVCKTVSEAVDEIAYLRNNTKKIGENLGFRIGISGTHPTAICKDQLFVNNESYNWVANQLSYYAKRNITFANHVHVAISDQECAIHVANSLRRWIAPLLSISTNSPFFEGELTGLRSSRTFQFGIFPRTNIPSKFNNFMDYKEIIDKYIDSDSITKSRQIWWKIRPHIKYGTIEFRICDGQRSLRNIEMLAALSQGLVHSAVCEYEKGILCESFNLEYLNDALWKASRFPIDSKVIDPITMEVSTIKKQLKIMLDYVKKSLKYFNNLHIIEAVEEIISNGTEGDKQLEVFNKFGFNQLKKYLMDNVEYDYN